MKNIYNLQTKQMIKKAEDLKRFLVDIDSICDKLYSNLQYQGVWDALMHLEEVRTRYYVEYYECQKILELKDYK